MRMQISKYKYFRVCISFLSFLFIFLSHPVQAQRTPWVVPEAYVNLKNPTKADSATLKSAKASYIKYCAPCHGDKGKGDGPANASLNPYPANHTAITMLKETDGALWYKITEGRNPMPENKSVLTANQRWELVNYIRTLAKSPSK
ncbi:MAG TPA: cytochrome c [Ginsengibacter sp.]|jgi:mono/diheme cytochrome c family protein